MNKEKLQQTLVDLGEKLEIMSVEEFQDEIAKMERDDPELYNYISEYFAQQEPVIISNSELLGEEYMSMPDTLDLNMLKQEPPFQLSLELVDRIYQDAIDSTSQK